MPKVEQLDWSKLKPATKEPRHIVGEGTKDHSTYTFKEPRKGSKNGAVKTTRKPKKVKAIDPSIRQYHDNALKGFFKSL